MKVYVVIDIENTDADVEKIFLDKEKAKEYKKTNEWFVLEEHEVIE